MTSPRSPTPATRQMDDSADQVPEKQHLEDSGACNHFETIDTLRAQEAILYDRFISFKENFRKNTQPIGKHAVIHHMVQHFYELESLTPQEKDLFKEPENFKYLLTMPWVRLVKEEEREMVGDLAFEESRREEPDPVFRQISNLEVRQAVKEIYKVFLEAKDYELVQKKQTRPAVSDEPPTPRPSAFAIALEDVKPEVRESAIAVTSALQALFKDTSIAKYCQPNGAHHLDHQSSFSTRSAVLWDRFTSPTHTITDALDHLIVKRRQDECSAFHKNNALDSTADALHANDKSPFNQAILNEYIKCQRETTRTDYQSLFVGFKVQQAVSRKVAAPIILSSAPQTLEEKRQARLNKHAAIAYQEEGLQDVDRTFTVYPAVEKLVKSSGTSPMKDIFEMANYHDLLDLNAHAIGRYLAKLSLGQFIIRDCTLSDKLLAFLTYGIGKEGCYPSLWEISLSGRHIEVGQRTIDIMVGIVKAKVEL